MLEEIREIAGTMSPHHRRAVMAVLEGDTATETLDGARRELAAFADHLRSREQGRPLANPRRASHIEAVTRAYDAVAAALNDRGAL